MPDQKIHKCVDRVEGKKGVTSPYGLCTWMKNEGKKMPETNFDTLESVFVGKDQMNESHNPMDIVFGYEVQEKAYPWEECRKEHSAELCGWIKKNNPDKGGETVAETVQRQLVEESIKKPCGCKRTS